jgi:hypothetical protein
MKGYWVTKCIGSNVKAIAISQKGVGLDDGVILVKSARRDALRILGLVPSVVVLRLDLLF